MTDNPETPNPESLAWVTCPICNGAPTHPDDPFGCDYCQGGGTVEWSRIGRDLTEEP